MSEKKKEDGMRNGFLTIKDLYSKISEYDPLHNDSFHPDQIDIARLFSMAISQYFRFNADADTWFMYDGICWRKDAGNMKVESIAQNYQKALYIFCLNTIIDDVKKRTDDEKAFYRLCERLADRTYRVKLLKDAAVHESITYNSLDQNKNFLNCQNGTLDLNTFELKGHNQNDMLSMVTRCNYVQDASSEAWIKFMDEIMQGDHEKIRYLQKIAGLCLTCDMTAEQSFILYGSTTRNGKSAFIETLGYMLGDYSVVSSPSMLEDRVKNSATASPDVACLAGKRLVRIPELPKKMLFNSSLFKQITGGDEITARFLHENNFDFSPVCKIVFNTNYLPDISDDSVFASDRLKVISFDRHFSEEEQDHTLKDRLREPENLSGILNWCLEGLRLYRSEGLHAPANVNSATQEFRDDQDKLKNFFNEVMISNPERNTSLKEAYQYYQLWCRDNGSGIDSKKSFKADLISHGLFKRYGVVDGMTIYNIIPWYSVSPDFINEHRI